MILIQLFIIMQNWAVIASEIINVVAAILFILLFSIYLYRLHRLSQTQRFLHLYPSLRILFVTIYILINIVQVILFAIEPISDDGIFNKIQLYFLVGTSLNSVILLYEIYILYVEIKKEKSFSFLHIIYWLYLSLISLMRLILQAYYEKGVDVTVVQLVLSSLLFADALILFGWSWFMRRREIQQFQKVARLRFNMLNQSSKSFGTRTSKMIEGVLETSDTGIFPYLNVQLRLHNQSELMIKTYSNSIQVSKQVKNVKDLEVFYQQTQRFKLKSTPKLLDQSINLVQLQKFFSELLSNWEYYEPFVLEFLNIDQQTQKQINRCRSQQSGHSQHFAFDSSRIYFDIKITNIAKIVDHYQFDVIVWTNDHQCKRTVHKRYSQFQEFDKKLKSFDFKGHKLKTPELPQKIYFNQSDQDKLEDRRAKLQVYIKRVLNDIIFVKNHTETRVFIFQFFRLDCEQYALLKQVNMPFPFSSFSFQKNALSKQLTDRGEPVTFYYFNVNINGQKMGVLRKRFRMFDQFNHELKRWMHNTLTQYKNIKLPTKIPHSSQNQKMKRHEQLVQYLNALVKIPNLQQLYEARRFLLSYQQIRQVNRNSKSEQMYLMRKSSGNSLLESERFSRMSQLIDNLQFDSSNL